MVKSKKNNLTFILKISLKAKPKKSGSFIIVNGKKIPLNKSRRNKMTSKTRGAKKASSAVKKRKVSSKPAKRMVLQRKAPQKALKKIAKDSSALVKKRAAKKLMPSSSTSDRGMKKVSLFVKEKSKDSNSLQSSSSSTGSENSGSKTI